MKIKKFVSSIYIYIRHAPLLPNDPPIKPVLILSEYIFLILDFIDFFAKIKMKIPTKSSFFSKTYSPKY